MALNLAILKSIKTAEPINSAVYFSSHQKSITMETNSFFDINLAAGQIPSLKFILPVILFELLYHTGNSQIVDPRQIQSYKGHTKNMNVYGFDKVIKPNLSGTSSYLYIVAATIRDDGENDTWSFITGTADIDIKIYGGENYDQLLFRNRLYGPFYEGKDDDGSLKYEWDDYWTVYYNNFCVLDLSKYNGNCIKVVLTEGDDQEWIQGDDDIVYTGYVCLDQVPSSGFMSFPHTCDIPSKCASIWFTTRQANGDNQSIGNIWQF